MSKTLKFVIGFVVGVSLAVSVPAVAQQIIEAKQGQPGVKGPWLVSVTSTGYPSTTAGASNEVLCLTASSVVLTAGATNRRAISVQNLGPNPIYVCAAATCTTGTGTMLEYKQSLQVNDVGILPSFSCRASTANQVAPAGTRVTEIW